jgi:phosphoglycolate phosphatase
VIKNIFFDLDGTLSDSREGILRSFNYALTKMGGDKIDISVINNYIGPKLTDSFKKLLNLKSEEEALKAVDCFREDYTVKGYKINKLYPEIPNVLKKLQAMHYNLFVATSKREDVAVNVIKYFNLEKFFKKIYGGGTTLSKDKLLKKILIENELVANECIMIGDTNYDFKAAKINQMVSIGVSWGFGTKEELQNADYIINKPVDIINWLEQH